jgi:hypothetical protein
VFGALVGKLKAAGVPEHVWVSPKAELGRDAQPRHHLQVASRWPMIATDVYRISGYIGGRFQSYTIGNILSAQFYAAALRAHPKIPASGKFDTLHTWLRDNVYRHGSKRVRVLPVNLGHRRPLS